MVHKGILKLGKSQISERGSATDSEENLHWKAVRSVNNIEVPLFLKHIVWYLD
jgi:hypothetical protein